MLFLKKQNDLDINNYKCYLNLVCSLSRLFSDNNVPYLQYRVAEKLFCKAFKAKDLSRSDCSADAVKDRMGIGLKTFIHGKGNTYQKIAEFNSARPSYERLLNSSKTKNELVNLIAQLRNERIDYTKRTYNIEQMIYHCVVREENKLLIYETEMDKVDIKSISNIMENDKNIYFQDGYNEYNFSISKSTLLKRFKTPSYYTTIPVNILNDPLLNLLELFDKKSFETFNDNDNNFIYLPLYSPRTHKVQEKSGLNVWNAAGRKRDFDEAYIIIPSWIHKSFTDFFPKKETSFNLVLPDNKTISAKLCQDGDKSLMSNPNSALGEWLLRKVLNIKKGELLTYEHLQKLGIDSVRIDKLDNSTFSIDFAGISKFDKFEEEYKK